MKKFSTTAASAAAWPTAGVLLRRLATAALATVLLLSVFAFAGCGEGVTAAAPDALGDDAAIREFMEEEGLFDDLGMYEAGEQSSGGGDREVIDPLTFWRVVTDLSVHRDVIVDTLAGTAEATIYREVWGELHIVTEGMEEIVKPFHHTGERYANFALAEDPVEDDREGGKHRYRCGRWELTEISGFLGQSDDLSLSIDWIHIQGDSVDVTITDPLELMTIPEEIMLFEVGEEVTVTVSGPPADAILFLHTRHWHSPFVFDGATFSGTWTVQRAGRCCAWVTALDHETLFDSDYPDDWMVWGMPYAVFRDAPGIE